MRTDRPPRTDRPLRTGRRPRADPGPGAGPPCLGPPCLGPSAPDVRAYRARGARPSPGAPWAPCRFSPPRALAADGSRPGRRATPTPSSVPSQSGTPVAPGRAQRRDHQRGHHRHHHLAQRFPWPRVGLRPPAEERALGEEAVQWVAVQRAGAQRREPRPVPRHPVEEADHQHHRAPEQTEGQRRPPPRRRAQLLDAVAVVEPCRPPPWGRP